MNRLLRGLVILIVLCLPALSGGCGKRAVDRALESDANGYFCPMCEAKFYTARDVFADHCPKCKNIRIEQVVGYVCAADHTTTVGARGRSALNCAKCGALTTGLSVPGEKELLAWGAVRKSKSDVCGP